MKALKIFAAFWLIPLVQPALAEDIKPGLWKISLLSTVAATPDWKPEPFESTQCLSETDAQNPDRLLLGMGTADVSGCKLLNRQFNGGHLSFDVDCEGILGIKGHGEINFTASSVDGVLDVNLGAEEKISMQNKIHASYLGACT